MDESKFNMWRAVVAVAHADNYLDPSEEIHIRECLAKLPLSPEQLSTLEAEVHTAAEIDPILEKITEPGDRAQVIYFARLLMWADGHYSEDEDDLLKHIHTHVMSKTDVNKAMETIHGLEAKMEEESDKHIYEQKSGSFIFKKFLDWVMF